MKTGFMHGGKRIYFIEAKGKDVSFERWRATLYYAPGFALTYFAQSQAEYDKFLALHNKDCYADYEEYKNS